MSLIGNTFWFILGGALMGLGWWLAGLLAFISIIGIPWGKACFVIGNFAFLPFGKKAVNRKYIYDKDGIGTGSLVPLEISYGLYLQGSGLLLVTCLQQLHAL